jgi:hypothetical protein
VFRDSNRERIRPAPDDLHFIDPIQVCDQALQPAKVAGQEAAIKSRRQSRLDLYWRHALKRALELELIHRAVQQGLGREEDADERRQYHRRNQYGPQIDPDLR